MISRIGDDQRMTVRRIDEPLGKSEGSRCERPVIPPLLSGADDGFDAAFRGDDEDAVIAGVGDGELGSGGAGGEFGWELQGSPHPRPFSLWGARRTKRTLSLFCRGGSLDELSDEVVNAVVVEFTGVASDDPALGIDKDESGPGIDSEALPDGVIGVGDDRMVDSETLDGQRETVRILFRGELGRVHANGLEPIRERFVQAMKVRQNVDTVDASGCPEIEQHDFAAQIGEAQRRGTDPGGAGWKLGGANGATVRSRVAFQGSTSRMQ